jgi:hypothetical protein
MATGPQDRERIRASLAELGILTSMAKKWNNLKIPEDPAERAERFLEKLNIFSHRYPFPKAVDYSSGIRQFPPEPISFADIETLREWLNVLKSIANSNALMFLPPYDFGMIGKYLNALAIRDRGKIEQSKSNPLLQATGEVDPYKIFNDFIKNIDHVVDICASTSIALEHR